MNEDEIRALLQNEVIKREVLEGEKAKQASKQVSKAEKKMQRKVKDTSEQENSPVVPEISN